MCTCVAEKIHGLDVHLLTAYTIGSVLIISGRGNYTSKLIAQSALSFIKETWSYLIEGRKA